MKRIIISLLFFALSASASAETEIKGTPEDLRQFLHPKENLVSINGQGEEKAYSDKAIVDIVITTEDKMLSKSLELNSKLRETIASSLKKIGLSDENIKSSRFSSSPQYGWFGKKPDSYQVINRMAVTISDESHLKAIALICDSNKEIELSKIIFEHSKKDEYREKVKKKALDDVLKQKELYERSLGIKLIPVGFNAERLAQPGSRGNRGEFTLDEIVVTAERKEPSSRSTSKPKEQEVPTAVSFDEIIYKAEITVVFKIDETTD